MSKLTDYFVNAQTIIVIVAILAWGWLTFFHDKVFAESPPARAEITHDIFSTCLDAKERLVRVKAEVRNAGTVPFSWSESRHSIAQVDPSPAGQGTDRLARDATLSGGPPGLIVWPESVAGTSGPTQVTLQPNESVAQYHDFLIEPSIRVIEIRSTFADASRGNDSNESSWQGSMKTIYDAGSPGCP